MFDAAIGLSERALLAGKTVFICDALYVSRYESSFREKWIAWFIKRRAGVHGLHSSVAGALPRMGLQLVNLALPGFAYAHDSDEALDVVLGPRREFQRLRAARDA